MRAGKAADLAHPGRQRAIGPELVEQLEPAGSLAGWPGHWCLLHFVGLRQLAALLPTRALSAGAMCSAAGCSSLCWRWSCVVLLALLAEHLTPGVGWLGAAAERLPVADGAAAASTLAGVGV